MNVIPDVQSSVDVRNLPIQQVGIKNLRFPLQWASANGPQATVALLTMTVYLPADQKGTHMSRFVQLMEDEAATVLDAQGLQNARGSGACAPSGDGSSTANTLHTRRAPHSP